MSVTPYGSCDLKLSQPWKPNHLFLFSPDSFPDQLSGRWPEHRCGWEAGGWSCVGGRAGISGARLRARISSVWHWRKLRLGCSAAEAQWFHSPPAPFQASLTTERHSQYYAETIKFILFLTSPDFQNCLPAGCSLWGGGGTDSSVDLSKPWSRALQSFALSSQQTGMMLGTVRRERRDCLLFFSCTVSISQTPSACGWLICSSSQEATFFFLCEMLTHTMICASCHQTWKSLGNWPSWW